MKYDFTAIEAKWHKIWDEKQLYAARTGSDAKKFYALVEFPYPSGAGLHVGHARPYTAMDVIARKHRMQGENVLFPMGYDAFGLPTENYAIKNHIHPAVVTKNNIATFRGQLQALGYSFDWDREINTTDPKYFKWTQWIFLQLYKNGLAYKAKMPVNWCTSCKCVLANEEVVENVCERCGSPVVRKEKSQWMLRITRYAQRLLDDLDDVDFIERVKIQQRNWIGRSTGAEVRFGSTFGDEITVFTTRPDTLFGATYMVLSPEHPLLERWMDRLTNADEVKAYQEAAAAKSDFERTELTKEKTGVQLGGVKGINPVNGKEIPIFISDYVLSTYGTGAIMAVPAHDDRDWEFAKKFGCEIIEVVKGGNVQEAAFTDCATGVMVNSGFLDGMSVADAKKAITEYLTEKHIGEAGSSPASVTGASRSPSSTARSAAPSRSMRRTCRWSCRMSRATSRRTTVSLRLPPSRTGSTRPAPAAAAQPSVKRTPCPSGPVPRGTICAIWIRTTTRPLPRPRPCATGARSTGTTAAWSTRRSICSTAASGTSSSMISASCRRRSPMPSVRATA